MALFKLNSGKNGYYLDVSDSNCAWGLVVHRVSKYPFKQKLWSESSLQKITVATLFFRFYQFMLQYFINYRFNIVQFHGLCNVPSRGIIFPLFIVESTRTPKCGSVKHRIFNSTRSKHFRSGSILDLNAWKNHTLSVIYMKECFCFRSGVHEYAENI